MSLSVCLMTAEPAARVAAVVDSLKPYADELIIAADSRVEEHTLAGYATLADRIFTIELQLSEQHQAWPLAECSGDWILRLDGDGVPSQAFLAQLPQMLRSRSVRQFWIANAWLFPDAGSILTRAPWSADFTDRLMRNDGALRPHGQVHMHGDPLTPREYVQAPFYRLGLLTACEQARRDSAVLGEVVRPHVLAPGGGRINEAFYLPELRGALERRPVPEEDRAPIARALHTTPPARTPPDTHAAAASSVTLRGIDRFWDRRSVGIDAYKASIEPYESDLTIAPGESRSLFLWVGNEGTERWPASLEEEPLIRLGYRWLNTDGSLHSEGAPRSPFPRVVRPGERVIAPLQVIGPTAPGDYILEADVVHERKRWFEAACRMPVHVGQPPDLPPAGARLRETPRPRLQRWRAVRIPRTIHRVWLGAPMPAQHQRFGESFAEHHAGWEMRVWGDRDLESLGIGVEERARCRTQRELANLARYEILSSFGGVYVDTDVECRRPFTPLLRGIDAFAALEHPGRVCNAVLGAIPEHPAFTRAARLARQTLGRGEHSVDANGPYFLSLLLEQEKDVAIMGSAVFYPYLWDELERRDERFPDAYAIHHWATGTTVRAAPIASEGRGAIGTS
jgi:Glycosyltransferase sugar-binding region containing DXD motif